MKGITAKGRYWTEEQDQAIIEYMNATSTEQRNLIYYTYLHAQMIAMSETIQKRYFGKSDSDLVHSSIVHVLENAFRNYDVDKKSFSFIQTVIKNFYHDHFLPIRIRKRDKIFLHSQSLDHFTYMDDIENPVPFQLILTDDYLDAESIRDIIISKIKVRVNRNDERLNDLNAFIDTLVTFITEEDSYSSTYLSLYLHVNSKLPFAMLRELSSTFFNKAIFINEHKVKRDLRDYAKLNLIEYSSTDEISVIQEWHKSALIKRKLFREGKVQEKKVRGTKKDKLILESI